MVLTIKKLWGRLTGHRLALVVILIWRLRPVNIVWTLLHRYRLKKGSYQQMLPAVAGGAVSAFWQGGEWRFDSFAGAGLRRASLARGDEIVVGIFRRFEDERIAEGAFPQWHKDSYSAQREQHFSTVAVNAVPGDDVKRCWDLSRFKWLSQLVVAAIHANDATAANVYLGRAQALLSDWVLNNGYFQGVNWACGQEVSIRGVHLMHALMLLKQHFNAQPTAAALDFLSMSCRRVEATLEYSLAQDNNHSLTETLFLFYAPLFIESFGSSVLLSSPAGKRRRRAYATLVRLVQSDGSFRMYSVNYHRAMCDLLSMYKLLDDGLGAKFWSDELLHRMCGMHAFLEAVIIGNGRAPAIGHNDGSLHVVQYSPYEDHVPSLALMSCAFGIPLSRQFGAVLETVFLFGRLPTFSEPSPEQRVRCFNDFGLVIVRYSEYQVFLKYARNAGRPSQEDFLHLDLWVRGQNILHDCGSFSYNPGDVALIERFDAATAHNGPYLKERPLVPRLSRFLYLEWPRVDVEYAVCDACVTVDLRLALSCGVTFQRTLQFEERSIHISDSGPSDEDWGLSFNFPTLVSADEGAGRLVLCQGVTLRSDDRLRVEHGVYSKRYLDMQEGTRVVIDGASGGRGTLIEIQDT